MICAVDEIALVSDPWPVELELMSLDTGEDPSVTTWVELDKRVAHYLGLIFRVVGTVSSVSGFSG